MRGLLRGCLVALGLMAGSVAAAEPAGVPLGQVERWLQFQRKDLDRLSVENGRLDFSDRFVFDGEYALRWSYGPGSTLGWRCDGTKLGYSAVFVLTVLAPRASGNLAVTVELCSGSTVACRFQVPLKRAGWNRCELQSSERYRKNSLQLGLEKLDGLIPDKVTAVRILGPRSGRGELYLGYLYLGAKPIMRLDTVADSIPAEEHRPSPRPPQPAELDALRLVEARAEQDLLQRPFKPLEEILPALRKQYQELHLRRTPDAMTGFNVTVDLQNDLGFESKERAYGLLMADVALAWRLSSDAAGKQELLGWYQDLFDFSVYVGGMPDAWAGGDGYLESVFLMRQPLRASGRLTPEVLEYFKQRQGYGRIFLKDSIFCRTWRDRTYRAGELGEDCDYTRLVTPRLLLLALMTPDPAEVVRDLRVLGAWYGHVVLAYSPGVLDTFKPDGSLFHHQGLQLGYGKGTLLAAARMIYCLSATPFAVPPPGHALFRETLLRQRDLWRANCAPLTLSGKEGFKREFAANESLAPWLLLALAGTPDGTQPIDREVAAAYLRMASENLREPHFLHAEALRKFAAAGVKPEPVPQGHWTLSYAAGAVHRRDDWLLSLRGYSRYFYAREAGLTFRFVPCLGFGTCELLTAGNYTKRYDAFYHETDLGRDGYDWTQFPGVTSVHLPLEKLRWTGWKQTLSDQAFVGGVDTGDGNGIFVLALHGPAEIGLDSFFAHKSWFFFDRTLVCLGSGIRNDVREYETGTTLFQDWLAKPDTPTDWNKPQPLTAFPCEENLQLAAPAWLLDRRRTGYYVFAGQRLQIRRGAQKSRTAEDQKDTLGNYAVAWLSHDKAPRKASYRYLMRPGATPAAMQTLAREMDTAPPYEIRRQDEAAHVVYGRRDGCVGYVVFQPDVELDAKPLARVSRPCVAWVRRDGENLVLAVADPDVRFIDRDRTPKDTWGGSEPSTIRLALAGAWNIAGTAPRNVGKVRHSQGQTQLEVTCRDGLSTEIVLRRQP